MDTHVLLAPAPNTSIIITATRGPQVQNGDMTTKEGCTCAYCLTDPLGLLLSVEPQCCNLVEGIAEGGRPTKGLLRVVERGLEGSDLQEEAPEGGGL